MKENWINKLLELLNEYEKKRIESVDAKWLAYNIKLLFRPYTERDLTNEAYKSVWLEICSKYYWFIQRLVQNNNIDRDKIIEKSDFMPIVSNKVWDFLQPTEEQELLMLLSISENPISDLISYLR